jgi:hypothetical protein
VANTSVVRNIHAYCYAAVLIIVAPSATFAQGFVEQFVKQAVNPPVPNLPGIPGVIPQPDHPKIVTGDGGGTKPPERKLPPGKAKPETQ